ncbi:hypothetical protein SAMN05216371_0869 [Streptomyces sp. TLI_053]|uniref:hypothetical protein n=1 Tax=Streptomyces sp. TLI_053 TaxID=1855352 RepID=UPI000879798E|nr:hypothetical protein [Streptomyces sp. TLI_053]SDS90914.1 hypothetical protein SAMN05216371_0869 [Streptomyces sp. TLI_053]
MSGALSPRLRRVVLVVDIEAYGGRPYWVQQAVQERLDRALDHACGRAGVDRARCEAQDRGDGQLLLLPPDVDEAKALPGLVLGLRDALHTLNRAPGTAGRLRVRAALAQGGVQRAALGYVARAVETACRLLDCEHARSALKDTPDTDLALVVTDDLFADAFAAGAGGLPVDDFTSVTVAVPAKRFKTKAWLGTPRHGALVVLPPPSAPGTPRRDRRSALLRGLGDAAAGIALGATPPARHHDDPPPHHDGDPDGHHGHHDHGHQDHGRHGGDGHGHGDHDGEHGHDAHGGDHDGGDHDGGDHDGYGDEPHGRHGGQHSPHQDGTPLHEDTWHHDGWGTDAWSTDPHHHGPHHEDTGTPYGEDHGGHDGQHGDHHDPFASPDHPDHDPGAGHWWHGPHH